MTWAMTLAAAPVAAQSSPLMALRLSMESAADHVGATAEGSGGSESAARFRLDLAHDRSSRRGTLKFWAGVTADQGLGGMTARTLAEAISLDAGITLSRRTRLEVSDRISWSPLDLFPVFGAADAESTRSVRSGSELQGDRTLTEASRLSVIRTLGRRSSASFTAAQSSSIRADEGVQTMTVNGRISRRVGPFATWHGGYGFTTTGFTGGLAAAGQRRHDLDIGVDYARPLPFSRNTTFTLTTGSTMLVDGESRHGRFNSTAGVLYHLTGVWTGRVDYTRPIQYVAGFKQPFLGDSARLSVSGPIGRGAAMSATAGYARGAVGLRADASGFVSFTSVVRVTRRLGAAWQWEAEYHDARYQLDRVPADAGAVPRVFARRGTRAALVWSPVIAR